LCRASIRATIVPMPDTDLQAWVGRTETLHDDITAAPLRAFSATLDRDDAPSTRGTPVPPLAAMGAGP
jgi:3-methylfumaryl-CoA hydratase